jgi:hypothetical protein
METGTHFKRELAPCLPNIETEHQQWRAVGGGAVFKPPSPKFRSFDKAEPNSQFRGKYIRYNPRHPESLTKSNRIAN